MRRHVSLMVQAAALLGMLCAGPAVADDPSWAALDEVPPQGGELRLAIAGEDYDANGQPAIAFPLQNTRVRAEIQGAMAQVEVIQTFANPYAQPLEAVYVFPLSPDAAVNGYQIVIGERVITGQIAKKAEAKALYEEAKAQGHTAGLLEQTKPNVFVQSIANIPPTSTIQVRFWFVELLQYEHERGYRFAYPMTITPRYLPHNTTDSKPVSGGGGAQAPTHVPYVEATQSGADVDIQVRIDAGVPLSSVSSPSHNVVVEALTGPTDRKVTLVQEDLIPNQDFVVDIDSASEQTLMGVLTHRDDEKGGFFTLLVQPKLEYADGDIAPREVVLVIDTSGSMAGEPLARAQYVAKRVLGSLRAGDTFNIITFASGSDELYPAAVAATKANVDAGLSHIQSLAAGGGTVMLGGIESAFAQSPGGGRIRMVYLLTDGGVGNDDEILAAIKSPEGQNRLFPVGISAAPNRYLIDRLADQGRGFATYLNLIEDPTAIVGKMIERSAWPYLTDITVDWGGLSVRQVTPEVLPDVYAGLPLVISGRFDQPGTATILVKGTRAGKPFALPLTVTLPDVEDRAPVAYVWATRRIRELLATQYGGELPEVVAEVTALGLEFALVTPYTSFIAVDDGATVEGSSVTVHQPNETPAGYGGGSPYGGGGGSSSWSSSDSHDKGGDAGLPMFLLVLALVVTAVRRQRTGEELHR